MWAPSGRLELLGSQRRPSRTEAFAAIREIEECHHIAGEANYLLTIRARDTRHLDAILERLEPSPPAYSTETDVAVSRMPTCGARCARWVS